MKINTILQVLTSFILFLYSIDSLTRNIVLKILQFFSKFLNETFLPDLQEDVLSVLKKPNAADEIKYIFSQYGGIFQYVDSENKIFARLNDKGFICPKPEKIGFKYVHDHVEDIHQVYVPLTNSLTKFFKIPGMYKNIERYIRIFQYDLMNNLKVVTNVLQSDL